MRVAIKRAGFKSSPPERLWQGPFTAPANTRYTSSFGVRRIYNGRTQSTHQGLDYSAAMGTEIKASNSGRAAIVRDMCFEGGLIVIDHGESVLTLYMHLSKFLVKEAAVVKVNPSPKVDRAAAPQALTCTSPYNGRVPTWSPQLCCAFGPNILILR